MKETSTRMKIWQAWKSTDRGSRVPKRSQVDLEIERDREHNGHERDDRQLMPVKESREIV